MTRDRLIESGVMGIAGAGTVAGPAILLYLGWPQDAVLGFFGAIVGVFLAIWGALWTEDYRRRRPFEEERRHLVEAMRPVADSIRSLDRTIEQLVVSNFDASIHLAASRKHPRECKALLEEALSHAQTLSFGDRVALNKMVACCESVMMLSEKLDPDPYILRRPETLDLWRSSLRRAAEGQGEALSAIEASRRGKISRTA